MNIIRYPIRKDWPGLLSRPAMNAEALDEKVKAILNQVKTGGDRALKELSALYDKRSPDKLFVDAEALAAAETMLSGELKRSINLAKRNIELFHASQKEVSRPIETSPGVLCWRKSVAVEKVGLYIPGGSAPLFSTVLMLGVPARLAGCDEIILCTPPGNDGFVHPAILYAAALCGISRVYKIGGAQAIAAMAYGTATVPRVDKIFGPGNQYVTAAKKLVSQDGTAIDLPAGPSELLVIADDSSVPAFVAADLLSQAEHGPDSQVILLSPSEKILLETVRQMQTQLKALLRKNIASQALENSRMILVKDIEEAFEISNRYAPEHLMLAIRNAGEESGKVINAGSVFLGNYSPESAGDYASGTNHTLPTGGYAKACSGVSLDSFIKKITFQELSPRGLALLGPSIECMAGAEELLAHRNAVSIRLSELERSGREEIAFDPFALLRPNIRALVPYSSARSEYTGPEAVFLDANENPMGSVTVQDYNRYPDPSQKAVKTKLALQKGVCTDNIFLGNGSDEAIDLLVRAFCEPGRDSIITLVPTYGMYKVCAAINNVSVKEISLTADFGIDVEPVKESMDSTTKLLFICSPNNPSGNRLSKEAIIGLLKIFQGLVVLDEAYIDFDEEQGFLKHLDEYPNLVILQTFSKAWGLAGIRAGMAFASAALIGILNRIKAPYNVSDVTQKILLEAMEKESKKKEMVKTILEERERMTVSLQKLPDVEKIYPSDSNFLLIKVKNADKTYEKLVKSGIVIRNRSSVPKCGNCLRITIGTRDENEMLIRCWSDRAEN